MKDQLIASADQVARFPCLAGMSLEAAQEFAKRVECWETQEWACHAILAVELLTPTVIDPCCGPGVMSEVAAHHRYHVRASDLHDWGYGEVRNANFLADDYPIPLAGHTVFMNPPFSVSCEFVEKALERGARKLVVFQRWAWRESKDRRAWWNARPPQRMYVCGERADPHLVVAGAEWRKGKSSPKAHGWFVWERGQPHGPLTGAIYKGATP